MKIIIVLFLSILFYPPLTTQDDAGVKKQVICNIAGSVWPSTYVFDVNQLPERCNIIDLGLYAFDRDNGVDIHVKESDKGVLRSLVEAKKIVYTRIGFTIQDNWSSIFDPPDADVFRTQIFDPLVNFLNTYKINGVLINFSSIYDIGVDDLAHKICDFVCAIKQEIDKLIVGMIISGSTYEQFTNTKLFDFTITNQVLDLYIIDLSALNDCEKETVKTGVSPVTSTNQNITTIEQVTCAVDYSTMDKSKIYAMIQMIAVIPENLLPEDAVYSVTTYSIYCASTDKANCNSSQWCTNPAQLSYDQGAHARKFYAGIVLDQLDTDDYENKCECGQFPVTNIIIDGWDGSAFKGCPKLDQK